MTVTLTAPDRRTGPLPLAGAEVFLIVFMAVLAIAVVTLTLVWDRNVDWLSFAQPLGASFGLLIFGVIVRAKRNMPRMGLLMIGVALYFGYGTFLSIFVSSFFPIFNPVIDDPLTRWDAALGHDWITFLTWLAEYPTIGKALKYVYLSSLGQLVVVFLCLAWANRPERMYHFVLTGALGLLITMLFWAAYPSFGPSLYQQVPPEVAQAINLFVDNDYGAVLQSYATHGIPVINPDAIKATIAFPSFHIVMACLVVWFLRGTPFIIPALLINIPMLPATVAHGAHHLVDLFGGMVVFVIALWIAGRILARVSPPSAPAYSL